MANEHLHSCADNRSPTASDRHAECRSERPAEGADERVERTRIEDLTAAYAVGPLGGRITLDGIRAAQNFDQAGLSGASTRTAMWGYSGGAIPTANAAELQPEYAPELNWSARRPVACSPISGRPWTTTTRRRPSVARCWADCSVSHANIPKSTDSSSGT
ncbi:lipase family protein [Nocardia fluminea]|uniref:lipase family protein n=1 Tax=Nocardia fluminea TaxID=134984 RepID=UPI0038120672